MDIALEIVCHVIHRARELVADVDPLEDEPGKRAADDTAEELSEEDEGGLSESAEYEELKEYIGNLHEDEQIELVALTWVGRGTYTAEDWDEAVETARDEHAKNAARYLLS